MPAIAARPKTLKASLRANHLAAIRRGKFVSRQFDRQAARVKANVRRIAVQGGADAQRQAENAVRELAAVFASQVQIALLTQAAITFRNVRDALNRVRPQAVGPMPLRIPPDLRAAIVPDPPPEQRNRDLLFLFGILGLVGAAVAAAGIANAGKGIEGADAAIDKLTGKAKTRVKAGGVAVSNRTVRKTVELALPVARRVPPEVLTPVPPLEPIYLPDPVKPKFPPRPSRGPKGPFPGEPEFVILPEPPPAVPVPPGKPPDVDPDPISPIPPADGVVGWQVFSVLIPTTRDKHRHRHRDVFYYHPRPERGEKGIDECPNPPYESERDGGKLAHNCLCWIAPLFAGPSP